jgi:hypothetical protein
MIDVNSNCSRVDAVKAMATQLKLQSPPKTDAAAAPSEPARENPKPQKIKSDFQGVEEAVKANDAKRAEQALAVVKNDLASAQANKKSDSESPSYGVSGPFRGLSVYA